MDGKSPQKQTTKSNSMVLTVDFMTIFLWCEFPGHVKNAGEKELFVIWIEIFFYLHGRGQRGPQHFVE